MQASINLMICCYSLHRLRIITYALSCNCKENYLIRVLVELKGFSAVIIVKNI